MGLFKARISLGTFTFSIADASSKETEPSPEVTGNAPTLMPFTPGLFFGLPSSEGVQISDLSQIPIPGSSGQRTPASP